MSFRWSTETMVPSSPMEISASLKNVDVAAPGRMKARCNEGLAAQMIHEESYARLDMKISLLRTLCRRSQFHHNASNQATILSWQPRVAGESGLSGMTARGVSSHRQPSPQARHDGGPQMMLRVGPLRIPSHPAVHACGFLRPHDFGSRRFAVGDAVRAYSRRRPQLLPPPGQPIAVPARPPAAPSPRAAACHNGASFDRFPR